jgi:lipid-A-disaccharide synthase
MIGVPMAIIYKVSPITYMIGKRLIRVDHIGICNIVAGERIVRELIQHDAIPEKIVEELARILTDGEYADSIKDKLGRVRLKLGKGGSSAAVAEIAFTMLQ